MFSEIYSNKLEKKFIEKAKEAQKTIALPEAEFSGIIIKAAEYCRKKGIANIVLIGNEQKIKNTFLNANFDGFKFMDPKSYDKTDELANKLYQIRKAKGLTLQKAKELIYNPIYFSTMLLNEGVVDGVVGGAATSTSNMLRPALEIIKTDGDYKTISSSFIMINSMNKRIGDKGVYVVGDCAVNINPNKDELADIALATAETARRLAELDPKIAMLSYSTHGSGKGESVDKVVKATKIVKKRAPGLMVEGELQADSALIERVAKVKSKNNEWKGDANVLIFPELNSANIGYKLMKIAGRAKAIGPIMQGFDKPVNDLSRGASLREIVLTIAITAMQADRLDEEERLERLEIERQERLEAKEQLKLERKLKRKEKFESFKNKFKFISKVKDEELNEEDADEETDLEEQELASHNEVNNEVNNEEPINKEINEEVKADEMAGENKANDAK